jgi:hypothetical protein
MKAAEKMTAVELPLLRRGAERPLITTPSMRRLLADSEALRRSKFVLVLPRCFPRKIKGSAVSS